jgi:hypothetical protein
MFCAQPEIIQHLFFDRHYDKFIWTTIQIAFNIQKPISFLHLFEDWANEGGL